MTFNFLQCCFDLDLDACSLYCSRLYFSVAFAVFISLCIYVCIFLEVKIEGIVIGILHLPATRGYAAKWVNVMTCTSEFRLKWLSALCVFCWLTVTFGLYRYSMHPSQKRNEHFLRHNCMLPVCGLGGREKRPNITSTIFCGAQTTIVRHFDPGTV